MNLRYKLLILIFALFAPLLIYLSLSERTDLATKESFLPSVSEVKIYVPIDENSLTVRTVTAEIPKDSYGLANLLFRKLKDHGVIPEETRLLYFARDDNGTIYVDFSKDLTKEELNFSEIALVYSIVNTFVSNFSSSRRVQLLIEGEPVNTLGGILFTYFPLEFNEDLMEE